MQYFGMCKSYSETVLFKASIVSDPQNYDTANSYIQCISENADHNTRSITKWWQYLSFDGVG